MSFERVYVKLPGWVGDVVMATPALRALRDAFPGSHITACAKAGHASLIEGLTSVDDFIRDPGKGTSATLQLASELRRRRFDLAVVLGESERAALPPAIARIPVRVGYGHGAARRLLLTRAVPRPRDEWGELLNFSMIERYLQIVRALDVPADDRGMEVPVTDTARERVAARLRRAGCGEGTPLVTVIAGAAYGASKRWPAARFAEACDELYERHGLVPVFAPAPGEFEVTNAVVQALGPTARSVVLDDPILDLVELGALLERSRLALSNDTGPRSIAVALGTPVVTLMGPTDEAHTAHHLDTQRVLTAAVDCRPCNLQACPTDHRCMLEIPASRAVDAASELLAAAATATATTTR